MSDALISQALSLIPVIIALLAALAIMTLTAWRPAIGCGLFVISNPLTTGLGRGTIIPLLRPNEAILLAVLAGFVLYQLGHQRRRPVDALDLAVGSFAIGTIAIALLVLFLSGSPNLLNIDTLRIVFSPGLFAVVYFIFSRTEFSSRALTSVLYLATLASIVVGLLAIGELAILPGVRNFLQTYYPPPTPAPGWDPIYRPMSTLSHYSALGAYAALNYMIALALVSVRHRSFSKLWLSVVMAINLGAVVASLTWAPLLVLPLSTGIVLRHARRVPRELGMTAVAFALAFLLFWPYINQRSDQQGVSSSVGQGLVIPQTLQFRINHWEEFFIPALADHLWLGTGTVLPSMVPEHLALFVDNEYLRAGFRAGIIGIALLLIMLGTIAAVGWQCRASPNATVRSLGAASVAMAIFFVMVGVSGEYLLFGGVSQEFAMLIGLLGATRLAEAAASTRRPVTPLRSRVAAA